MAKLQLSKAQRDTVTLIKSRALMVHPSTHAVQSFHLGIASERRHAATLVEQSKIGTPAQRKALADLIRVGRELAPEVSKLN